jgi:hypothetical protein
MIQMHSVVLALSGKCVWTSIWMRTLASTMNWKCICKCQSREGVTVILMCGLQEDTPRGTASLCTPTCPALVLLIIRGGSQHFP